MTTLEKIKLAIRRSHDKLDEDLQADIDFAKADLQRVGIVHAGEEDPLIYNAIKLYCQAANTGDPVQGAEYLKRYEALKSCLQLAEGYGWKAGADE